MLSNFSIRVTVESAVRGHEGSRVAASRFLCNRTATRGSTAGGGVAEPADPAGGAGSTDQPGEEPAEQSVQGVTVCGRQHGQGLLEDKCAGLGHGVGTGVPFGGEHDRSGTTVRAGFAGDQVSGGQAVYEPHGTRVRQPEHLGQDVDRRPVEELVQRRERDAVVRGLLPGRADRVSRPVGQNKG